MHWYTGPIQPIPEAYKLIQDKNEWFVDIKDIHEFVKKHGPIQLHPPHSNPYNCAYWIILIIDKSG